MTDVYSVPTALRKAGIHSVSTNRSANQTLVLKPGAIGLFFGEELAERLLAKQKNKECANG
ncbi:hypothetical protein KUL42_10040 [Alteromonas sp. KUL42]|uniref:hypothetical protein n=1 Tax=Alteromonas sp. KUL42 TaxID=2480797 RepID=UPI0010356AFF|nr:hypothetical protein [Alteromonas sp. KUL42]TAP37793.1 hypothetical protein EYR97_04990 [Alteromonas sp. KUL42]GEA06243.1 hypothetical protein KUL42_10040 [Alteromonas sp. KUL42]